MKKIVTIVLAVCLAISFSLPAFAFVPQRIKSLHPQFAEQISSASFEGTGMAVTNLTQLEASPSSILEIPLVGKDGTALFFDQNSASIDTADITISKMRAANLNVRFDSSAGRELISSVELVVKNSGTSAATPVLQIKFEPEFKKLNREPFSASIVLLFGDVEESESKIEIAGDFGNAETDIFASDANIFADATVLVARENVEDIVIDAGAGVSVTAKLNQGGRYLVFAAESTDDTNADLSEKNKNVVEVLELNLVGFSAGEIKNVRIDSNTPLQVYDKNGKRLGSTDAPLPVDDKYYLVGKNLRF